MAPLFDSLHISLALQGHDHVYEVMGPIKNKALVAGSVTGQTAVPVDARANLTGKLGGTFDVANGTLYFLDNSAGKKKYEPRSKLAMDTVEAGLGITNYFSFFTGRFGQTGEPTFSEVKVSTDSINISTYTVSDAGTATLFDAFKVVRGSSTSVKGAMGQRMLHAAFGPMGHPLIVAGNVAGIEMKIKVYSLNGSRIAEHSSKEASTLINLPSLSKGVYFVHVKVEGATTTFKVSKN